MELTSKQRAQLRGMAANLDTIVHVGKDGIGENLIKQVNDALEARELWQESAERTTRLMGVKATKRKLEGYPVTRVDILDHRGEEALGKPRGSYFTIDLTTFWQRKADFFERPSGPWAQS